MDFGCFKFILILALVERIRSLPLACPYNGTSYKEGESVRTEEPCLSCVCQKGALECSLRVCAEYPNVLPPACFLVHKPNDCCPQLFCEEKISPTGVELRTGFKLETRLHGNDCVINGSVYAEGSAVASSRVCEYCYCVEGEMKCIKPRCLQSFEGCKAVYEKSSCCPTHYDCRDADVDYLTMQIKNFAKVHPAVSSDSLRSFSSTDLSSDEVYLNANDTTSTDSIKTEDVSTEESLETTTEEINTEETTDEPEEESTVPSTKDWVTTIGFQTTKTENSEEESTKVSLSETTTLEPETDLNISSFTVMENQKETASVQTRSKIDFRGGIESSAGNSDNSSLLDENDYDSYDYGEPRLPPSLPNLVIFPFVAADAVVKDENANMPAPFEKVGVERIDTHPVFFKDHFSPPLKTEGGFVPKEPTKADEPFYEYGYFGKEQMEPPSATVEEYSGAQVQTNASPLTLSGNCVSDGREVQHQEMLQTSRNCVTCTCQHGSVICQDVGCSQSKPETIILENQEEITSILKNGSNVELDPFEQTSRPDSVTPPALILKKEEMEFNESHLTKKPVTVTYKNFVVDFYPNYLITTTRGHFKLQSVESVAQRTTEEDFQSPTQSIQNTVLPLTTTITPPPLNFFNVADTSIPETTTEEISTKETSELSPATVTTSEMNFFEEFVKSFLSNDATSEAVTTTTTSTVTAKRKYSSKIKGQIIATTKPREEIRKNTTPEMNKVNSIIQPEGVTERTKNHMVTQKSVKKDGLKQAIKTASNQFIEQLSTSVTKPMETKNTKVEFSDFTAEDNQPSESRKGSVETSESGSTGMIPNAGALLKLAGCNIYGMMYRVGKVITELSGPCLECLCTELGVQCRPLKC